MNKKQMVGLIGLGHWGKNILRNLREMGVLHTACDSHPDTIKKWQENYPEAKFVHNYEDMLADEAIKAIVIAAPAEKHFEIAKKSFAAGKDVFVEKPLALTINQGQELVDIAARQKRILMVGHILQYHPAVIKLKEMVASGMLGKTQYVYSNRLNIGKLRSEENILWSFAPHDISVILMLLEEMPSRVTAFGGDYINNGIYDTTMTTLEFKNGVKGHLFVSWLHPFKEQKLVVVGSKGMAVFDDLSKDKLFFYPHKIEWQEGKIPVAQKADFQVVEVEKAEPLRAELSHFLNCVETRATPKTDGMEGLRVLTILEQTENSLSKMEEKRETSDYYAHPSAIIDDNVRIGAGSKIWHFCHVIKNTEMGERCVLGQNVMVGPNVKIGNNVKIQNNVSVYDGVELEDDVFCGPSMVFTNVVNPRSFIIRKDEFRKTLVKRGASLGANSTIVCGVTVGEYALVAAGAVVTKDVAPFELMAGIPAKRIAWICKCGVTLKNISNKNNECQSCGSTYKLSNNRLDLVEDKT